MQYLGIDYGDRWIGLALGDDEIRIASPFLTFENTGDATLIELETLVMSEGIDCIVVGVPLNPGESGEQEEKTRAFMRELSYRVLCPVKEFDERFTSKEARTHMRAGGGDEHALAAMLILQSYLDSSLTTNP